MTGDGKSGEKESRLLTALFELHDVGADHNGGFVESRLDDRILGGKACDAGKFFTHKDGEMSACRNF